MSYVFLLDANTHPLDPIHPGRARTLLSTGQAVVYRRFPFTLLLKRVVEHPVVHPFRLKIDPGSRTTGLALVNDATGDVVFAAELSHRGQQITKALESRRAVRRSRRQRKTRYRKARWQNRRRTKGWLPPSLERRITNVMTWVARLMRLCPITSISLELVKFDMQAMENPDIQGVDYQQGELAGYELRAYLLEKWQRRCAYCGKENTPLQIEHIQARARGGSHRPSNLTLACEACNQAKGTQDIRAFLAKKPQVLTRLLAHAKAPLTDAAAMNASRWALLERLKGCGVPVETGSGGLTAYNRSQRGLPKTHWLDAACVGASTPQVLSVCGVVPLFIVATGHGNRQKCLMNAFGFARTAPKGAKRVKGFQTGDIVRAVVPTGAKAGTYLGKVALRATGSFNITTAAGTVQGMSHRFCTIVHRCDGYRYEERRGGNSSPA